MGPRNVSGEGPEWENVYVPSIKYWYLWKSSMNECPGQKWDLCLTMIGNVSKGMRVKERSGREMSSSDHCNNFILIPRKGRACFVFLLISWWSNWSQSSLALHKGLQSPLCAENSDLLQKLSMSRKLRLPAFGSPSIYWQTNDSL